MSLILDALNRADRDRSEQNLNISLHPSQSPAPQGDKPVKRWLLEGALVLVAVVAIIYALWFSNDAAEQPLRIDPQESRPAELQAALKSDAVTQTPVEPVSATPKSVQPEWPETKAAASPSTSANTSSSAPAELLPEPLSKEASSISSLYQQAESVEPKPASEASQPPVKAAAKPTLVAKPKPKPGDITQSVLQQIPLLTEMSYRFQRTVPNIDYSVHVFAEGGRGFVTLNGRNYKTGAVVEPGLRVIAILQDSVVLDLNGRQFRLPALNSWVNYQ